MAWSVEIRASGYFAAAVRMSFNSVHYSQSEGIIDAKIVHTSEAPTSVRATADVSFASLLTDPWPCQVIVSNTKCTYRLPP